MSKLKLAADFKKGDGYLFDPETGKVFDNFMLDWTWSAVEDRVTAVSIAIFSKNDVVPLSNIDE